MYLPNLAVLDGFNRSASANHLSPKSVPTPAGGYSNVSAFNQNNNNNYAGGRHNADLLMLSESPRLVKGMGNNMPSGPTKVHMNTTAAIVAL